MVQLIVEGVVVEGVVVCFL